MARRLLGFSRQSTTKRLPQRRGGVSRPNGTWTKASCWQQRDAFFVCANLMQELLRMKKIKLVMVGNGMAGVRTLEEL
ncbi:hypothetical protein, partial [Pseudomonas aeruginosa]